MNTIISNVIAAIILVATISSCHRDDGSITCPGPVVVNWKADGTAYKASTSIAVKVSTVFNLTIVACANQSPDRTISIGFIPYPPTVGSYAIQNDQTTGTWNGTLQGSYSVGTGASNDVSYFTDSLVNNGTLTITSVNTGAKKFSGSFNFKAKEHNGTAVINLTDGLLSDVVYP